MLKRLIIAAVCVALLAAATVDWRVSAQSGALTRLLGQVPDTAASRTVIWYGALGELETQLNLQINSRDDVQRLSPAQQATYLFEVGPQVYFSPFSGVDDPQGWAQSFGINPFAIDRELTVGRDPEQFGILEGNFDAGQIGGALSGLGYGQEQIGGAAVFTLGADNARTTAAGASLNRLYVTPNQIIAAPSTALIQSVIGGGPRLNADPAYAAMASSLEAAGTVSGTTLLSAALFDGPFLATSINRAVQSSGQARAAIGLSGELPPYQNAAIGYRRGAQGRALVVVLVYDAGSAQAAGAELAARMQNYVSLTRGDRLFDGWQLGGGILPLPDGRQAVVITAQMPDRSDVAWVQLVQARDLGFLAVP